MFTRPKKLFITQGQQNLKKKINKIFFFPRYKKEITDLQRADSTVDSKNNVRLRDFWPGQAADITSYCSSLTTA